MTEMEIKQVGEHLEAVCSGCGEVMLIGSGDEVNFRPGPTEMVGGVEVPTPQAMLCSSCGIKESPGEQMTIKFLRLSCSRCGREASDSESILDFEPEFDEAGRLSRVFCSDCSEPWRREE